MPLGQLDRISCFETLRAYGGEPFLWREHYGRLGESCKAIGRPLPEGSGELKRWAEDSLRESGWGEALVRLSVHWPESRGEGRWVLLARPFQPYPYEWYKKGVHLKTAVVRRWTLRAQDPQIKASQFMGGVLAFLDGASESPREWLQLGPAGTVAEGTTSNIFIVVPASGYRDRENQKRLLTPSVSSGILRGVTRNFVMGLARKKGLDTRETFLTRHDLYSADECFITNTSSEVLPVAAVDGRKIGDGRPGPVTRLLAREFKKHHE